MEVARSYRIIKETWSSDGCGSCVGCCFGQAVGSAGDLKCYLVDPKGNSGVQVPSQTEAAWRFVLSVSGKAPECNDAFE